jgi:DNA-binding response OmpR family regulator
MRQEIGRVVLLTEDVTVARQLEHLVHRDGMELMQVKSGSEAWLAMNRHQPQVLIVDLTSRAIDGQQLVSLSARARQSDIAMLLLSRQNRRELASFAAVVRARDILCKSEPAPNLAARIRMWVAATQSQLARAI